VRAVPRSGYSCHHNGNAGVAAGVQPHLATKGSPIAIGPIQSRCPPTHGPPPASPLSLVALPGRMLAVRLHWTFSVCLWVSAVLGACAASAAALTIDGLVDEPEWQQAQVFHDFVVTQPFTLAKPDYPAEARLLGTAEGIAIAFVVEQPHAVVRQHAQTPRDADIPGDRVNVFIDFNADGVTAFNFTVGLSGAVQDATLTNENQYSTDWDGDWQHAVHEAADRWTVEILLPWATASMHNSAAERRTVAVLFDRVLGVNNQRSASAAESFERSRFVSNFPHAEIAQFPQANFHVFPYVSLLGDRVQRRIETKAGLDLFWKPSGDFQLAAALNPDFGQVEADQLVVNFDAIETFFSDKRPFFTENQGFFDLPTPNGGQLIYTRRIGAARDDGAGPAEIDAAIKVIGSTHGLNYGVLGTLESNYSDDLGRAFYAQRLSFPSGPLTLGYVGSYVDRPFLNRHALVNGFDLNWRRDEHLSIEGQVVQTDVQVARDSQRDGMQWIRIDLTPDGPWRHQFELSHFGKDLDFNDLGFLPRANLNQLRAENSYTDSHFGVGSPFQSVQWLLQAQIDYNDNGDRLPARLALNALSTLRNGNDLALYLIDNTAGINDLITRGHGNVHLPARPRVQLVWSTPRRGDWSFFATASVTGEGLGKPAFFGLLEASRFVSDQLTINASINPRTSKDWLLWRHDNVLARYDHDQIGLALNLDWLPAERHELRAKAQWFVIDASNPRALRVGADGELLPSTAAVAPFSVADFGLQLRYRWTFAAQSDVYVVYSRGGFDFDDSNERTSGVPNLLADATQLRDSDQFLVKLRYRF
jgi:hypothetical protein